MIQDIITDKYTIIGNSINVYTETISENVAMVESSSAVQKFKKSQVLKVNCLYNIKGEIDSRGITVTVGILNSLVSVLYTETNKIIPTEYVKGIDYTKEQIIDSLKKEIDSYLAGYKIENNFIRNSKVAEAKYSIILDS